MKLLSKNIDYKEMSGKITVIPENDEDMWVIYNLVNIADNVTASTIRKVQIESGTGSANSKTVRINLTISVTTLDFDSEASQIFIKGKNIKENDYVKLGAYHSISLILNQKFTLFKSSWDSITLDLIKKCTDITQHADLAAVVMQEGLAYVCLITDSATFVRAKIDINIPQKRKGIPTSHDKAVDKFIEQVFFAIEKHVKFDVVKCVILASPGFLNEKLYNYIKEVSTNDDKKVFLDNKHKFLLVHSSTGHKHSLKEVLADPAVQLKTANTKASSDVKLLADFFKMMKYDENRAFYGIKHVLYAHESNAIDTLLISDSLFRSKNHEERKKFVNLVDSVKSSQGIVRVFSSRHISGEQLDDLTGVAAILRFPLPEPPCDSDVSDNDMD